MSKTHEKWLRDVTALPTAAGREDRVIAWVERWLSRRRNLRCRRDAAGNLFITRTGRRSRRRPIFITAHLDHPAFVVRRLRSEREVELEFRGGVHPPYFEDAAIEIVDDADGVHRARITRLDAKAQPYKLVTARLTRGTDALQPGDIGRWRFGGKAVPRVDGDILHTHACDDLAAVVAALAALDTLRRRQGTEHVGVLLTRAEEVGFIGAIAACDADSIPREARLICLENSRSFPESPIGAGPILRVGDRISVFDPRLTNRIGDILTEHAKRKPSFRWQRKLMPGGACEATAFSSYGYESTCVCLPLGNYHNMRDIDAVLAGKRPARVGPEFISVSDFHGLVELLVVAVPRLDSARLPSLRVKMEKLLRSRRAVLEG